MIKLLLKTDEAYIRLKALYGISKQLASFENVDKSFPKILKLADVTFPIATAILVECGPSQLRTTVWRSVNVTQEELVSATEHAKQECDYIFEKMITNPVIYWAKKMSTVILSCL